MEAGRGDDDIGIQMLAGFQRDAGLIEGLDLIETLAFGSLAVRPVAS
jgi:hypothetical protein